MSVSENRDLIIDSVAASAAGLSLNTLNRFAEAGYLRTERASSGERLFSVRDLEKVFDVRLKTRPISAADSALPQASLDRSIEEEAVGLAVSQPEEPKLLAESVEVERIEVADDFFSAASDKPKLEHIVIESGSASKDDSTIALNQEVQKLKNVVALQEKLLELREQELVDLKEQRSWLRARVEKLEEKADRDQLLLLSETQMITRLIAANQKKSPVRLALEWLGVRQPDNSESGTIEVKPQR